MYLHWVAEEEAPTPQAISPAAATLTGVGVGLGVGEGEGVGVGEGGGGDSIDPWPPQAKTKQQPHRSHTHARLRCRRLTRRLPPPGICSAWFRCKGERISPNRLWNRPAPARSKPARLDSPVRQLKARVG